MKQRYGCLLVALHTTMPCQSAGFKPSGVVILRLPAIDNVAAKHREDLRRTCLAFDRGYYGRRTLAISDCEGTMRKAFLWDVLTASVAFVVIMFAGLWGISQFTAKPMELWMAWPQLLMPPFAVAAALLLTSSSPPPDRRR